VSLKAPPPGGVKVLLSLQVLLDLCGTTANPARDWAQSVPTARLRLSVITMALARDTVSGIPSVASRQRLGARLEDLIAKLKADGGQALPFTESAASTWRSFMREPTLGSMAQVDRQFYAAAFSEGLCVVEYEHAHSAALAPLGLEVESLGRRP
jgi:hypothetical protein